MSFSTYTLVVSEDETGEGIVAEVREKGTIESTTRVTYDDYGLTASDDERTPDEVRREAEADVRTLRLQSERDGEGFTFRVVGDMDHTVIEERVTDEEWGLTSL